MSRENTFDARATLRVADTDYTVYRLDALDKRYDVATLPLSLKILLENLLRHENGENVTRADIEALAGWEPGSPRREIAFTPARVLMQDFTGVPAIVDLAAMRDAMAELGGDPGRINPLSPAELVIDHSVQVDFFGRSNASARNAEIEFQRNRERYEFLRWGQQAFDNLKVVPPDTGIVHQVNLEHLARGVFERRANGSRTAYPDTLVGTDSHTTMINGLGVLGWGVGGIEAEAAMLGQPISMLVPETVSMELTGELAEGVTATDLVLTITERLRRHGVVGKFVEFNGDGLARLPLADRATIANMAPEYGATCGLFPIDQETLAYLELSGRPPQQLALVEAYARAQGMWREPGAPAARYSETLHLDLGAVSPSLAGPKRPQDRVPLDKVAECSRNTIQEMAAQRKGAGRVEVQPDQGTAYVLEDGAVTIAAITSCTNTSNPSVMIGAGLLARKARAARAHCQALGQDQPCARLAGGTELSAGGRPAQQSGGARVSRRRLRLYHLHRQLRPTAGADQPGDPRGQPGNRRRALRQPQLRGARTPRGRHELPRFPTAGSRLRAGRHHWHRLNDAAAGHGPGRQASLSQGGLAEPRGDRGNLPRLLQSTYLRGQLPRRL